MMLIVSTVLLVGCGGGGTSKDGGKNPSGTISSYINKKLPVIQENSIPDILLDGKSSKSKKQYKEIGEQSSGYTQLKEKAAFFYKKQLQMNMELGYMDSIWEQIESYCKEKDICNVPNAEIVFTYTNALYKRDITLITKYEEKTGIEYQNNGILKEDLKTIIGQSVKLSSAKLVTDDEAEYKYVLSTEQLGDQEENPNLERSIVKWNDDNDNYFIREEVEGTIDGKSSGKPDWTQFEYSEKDGEKVSIFVSKDNFLGYDNEHLEFREKDDEVHFVQDEPNEYMDEASYYAEGVLSSIGGSMTVVGAGESTYEKFDENGLLLSTVKCLDIVKDFNNIPEHAWCSINDPSLIKKYITKSVYGLGAAFGDDFGYIASSDSDIVSKNMIKFDDNNTLFAIIDCTKFTADYTTSNKGIIFSNIVRTPLDNLMCLDSTNQDMFEEFLQQGYNGGYDIAFDFWPMFDNLGTVTDFNMTQFYDLLNEGKFVNAPLINSVFDIKTTYDYTNVETGLYFKFEHKPNIKVEDEKIIIELLDANFTAELEVVDSRHIKFKNAIRTNKMNVIYPVDINETPCIPVHEEDCMVDPYDAMFDTKYGERIFADIIEVFLDEVIEVKTTNGRYDNIIFEGTKLSLLGTIKSPEPSVPVVIPLHLTVGEESSTSVYSPHGTPIVLLDGTKDITKVSINKEGNIELQGPDADLFTLSNNQLSFIAEVNASNPIDANEDGIYELEIKATDNDGQTVRYGVWYKVYIPGTIIAKEIQDMAGIWDFSEGYNRTHYKEIRNNGGIQIYDYDDTRKCYEIVTSAIAIRKGEKEATFEEYGVNDINERIYSSFTAEILNDILIRTHTNNLSELPKINRVSQTADELLQQECPK